MFYHILYPLHEMWSGLNIFKYITVRTFAALFTGFTVYFCLGKTWISYLKSKQFQQSIREDGPKEHLKKKGTPTMGGLLIVIAVLISMGLWGNWINPYVRVCLFVYLSMGLIGFVDDFQKISKKNSLGFEGKYKIILEVLICLTAALWMYGAIGLETRFYVPFFKEVQIDLDFGYLFFSILVLVGSANAVNLTDGLDGLVTVPSITCFLTFGILAYVAGHVVLADYLQIPYVPEAGEVAVLCGAVLGACLGFLWFNAYPAEIFMGDVGSLSIGGLLGTIALITKQEILLVIIGGIFVFETLSVISQVLSFKIRGKRIFKMAPIHHHYELKGLSEPKIIVRFWIVSILLALLSLLTLKIR